MTSPLPKMAPVAGADPVKDVSLSTFMVDVIEASKQQLVVVDFWATWCGPCKQLTPVLEKVIRATKGAARLAKIDIDRNPEIAQQMGVQSVPAVFAFFQGRPVDGFMGALPESQVKSWLDRLLQATGAGGGDAADDKAGLDRALQQAADFLAANDIVTAQSIYADILEMDPANVTAYAGLVRCALAAGDVEKAKQMLAAAPKEIAKDKALDSVRAAVDLAAEAVPSDELDRLKAEAEQNPADHQAHFDLAMAYYAAGNREEAVEGLLNLVKRDRKWNDDAARKQLVKLFEAFGPMDPLTLSARKRLSSILFS